MLPQTDTAIEKPSIFKSFPTIFGTFAIFLGLSCQSAFAKGFQSAKIFSAGRQLSGMVVADFNNDGHPDLLVIENPGSGLTNTIHVLLGGVPTTIFSEPIDSNAGVNLSAVVAADFDGDGIIDIAVTDSVANTITILLGNNDGTGKGDGTFAIKSSLPTGMTPIAIALADLNGDGIKDIAVINSGDATLYTYTVKNDATATMTAKSVIALGPESTPVALTTADFNNDGKMDVAVALVAHNSMVVLSNSFVTLKGNGDGTVGTPVKSFVPVFNATAIAAVDLNQDGIQDVVITTDKVLYIRGSGDFVFQTPVPLDAQTRPNSIAIADMNKDGHQDIVVGNWFSSSITVFTNDGFSGITSVQSVSVVEIPIAVGVGDFNGDGIPDVVAISSLTTSNYGKSNIQLVLGNGDGLIRGAFTYDYFSGGAVGSAISAVVDDFNQDGRPDIAIADGVGRVTLMKNLDKFKFGLALPAKPVPVGFNMVSVDVNHDGRKDLIVSGFTTISVLLGNGDGTFSDPIVFNVVSGNHNIAVGDFNNDGNIDLVYTQPIVEQNATTVGVVFGNGDGSFQSLNYLNIYSVGNYPAAVAVGDFNNDGKLDVATTLAGENKVAILVGLGTGTFAIAPQKSTVGLAPNRAIIAADVNNDGIPDLVVTNMGKQNPIAGDPLSVLVSLSVLLGNGDATFKPSLFLPLKAIAGSVAIGDFNADGLQDIAVSEQGGFIEVFSNNGEGTFNLPQQLASPSGAANLCAVDMSNGGVPDLVAIGDQAVILPNTGGTRVTASSSPNPSTFRQAASVSATVTPNVPGMPTATGGLHFEDTGANLGTFNLPLVGSFSLPTLSVGSHPISVTYSGDDNYYPRTLIPLSHVVKKAPTTSTVSAATLKSIVGIAITFNSAFGSAVGGGLTGLASLLDGTNVIATAPLDGLGNATFRVSTLSTGVHSISTKYSGDQNFNPSTSSSLTINVIDFNLSLIRPVRSRRDAAVQQGKPSFQLEASAAGGEAQSVHLACSGLPVGMSCNFGAQDFLLHGKQTVDVVIDSPLRAARLRSHANARSVSVEVSMTAGSFIKKITVPIQLP